MDKHLTSNGNNEEVKRRQKNNASFMAGIKSAESSHSSFSDAFKAAAVEVIASGEKSSTNPITELAFENYIVGLLTVNSNPFRLELFEYANFEKEYAVESNSLFKYLYHNYKRDMEYIFASHAFKILLTQEEKEKLFVIKLWEARTEYGLINVMRYGFDIAGTNIKLFKEKDSLNNNFASLIRQVHYETIPPANKSIDIVIFLNGMPISVIELKNNMTGQSRKDAESQFMQRSNKEPLFIPNVGALTFFAVDENTSSVATSVVGNATTFIPFRPSFENPRLDTLKKEDEMGNQTYYMWERFWNKKGIINLVSNYLYQTTNTLQTSMAKTIMPRYHQIDVVDSIVNNPVAHIGNSTLIQHSAGSGKTKTIAWLASALRKMVDENGQKTFDTIIIVANRTPIVQHLSDAVYEYDRTLNFKDVQASKTHELHKIIESNESDVVATTIQKFGVLAKTISEINDKKPNAKYAIIVDEAHSGTSGEHGANIRQLGAKSEKVNAEDEFSKLKNETSQIKNLTFFAFTATPKTDTLMVYGEKVYDAFTMKEAINNKLILNTVTNYATYNMTPKAVLDGEDTLLKDKTKALSDLRKDARNSAEVLKEKVKVTLQHMEETVTKMLEGKGKGIVVTYDIRSAMLWYKTIKTFTKNGQYLNIQPLIAFSGKSLDYINSDGESQSQETTEEKINGFKESELPAKFDGDEYNLLIVVDKYQVGFDQPKLCAMYLDKTVKDVNAIQTLSRLNRVFPNKEEVYVIDFAGNETNVEEAFSKYSIAFEPKEFKVKYRLSDLERIATHIVDSEILTAQDIKRFYTAWNGDKTLPANQKILKGVIRSVQENMEELLEINRPQLDTFFRNLNKYIEAYNYIITTSNTMIQNDALIAMHQIARILKYQAPKDEQLNKDWLEEVSVEIPELELLFKQLDSEGEKQSSDSDTKTTQGLKEKDDEEEQEIQEPVEALASEVIEEYNRSLEAENFYRVFEESDEQAIYEVSEAEVLDIDDSKTIPDQMVHKESGMPEEPKTVAKNNENKSRKAIYIAVPISFSIVATVVMIILGIL